MNNFDLVKYGSHAVVAYLGLTAYDVFVEGKTFTESFTMNDAGTFALSTVVSNLAFEVVSGMLPYFNEGSISGMIGKPLLNGIVYMYLYNSFVDGKYPYTRDGMKAFYIGAIGSLLVGYLENPLMGLFSIRSF
jgi:hypothetical protein